MWLFDSSKARAAMLKDTGLTAEAQNARGEIEVEYGRDIFNIDTRDATLIMIAGLLRRVHELENGNDHG